MIELSPQEALLLSILREAQVLNIRNGRAILHFNNDAILMKVDCEFSTYKRKSLDTQNIGGKM
jgi:hypothetical protein